MSQNIDVAALIDGAAWTTYQKLMTALAALAVIFDGFDIQILAFAMPSLIQEWHATRSDFGPVLAIGLAGMVIGGPLAGYIGDRFGRRPALIGSVVVFGLATIATASVQGIIGLAIFRFITGLGAGGAVPNASALTAEFAPLRRRPMAVKLTIVCIPLGGMLGGLIAARILPVYGWRTLYMIGGVTPLLLAMLLLWALPESPRFLARRTDLRSQLIKLLTRMGHTLPAGVTFAEGSQQVSAERASLRTLFGMGLAHDTAGLWFAYFFCLGAIYLVFGWLPAMLTAQGLDVASASSALAIYNFGGVLGVLLYTLLMTMLGSRGPLLFGSLAAAASALVMLLIPISAHANATLFLAFLGLNGLLANAVQTSMYALAAHVYPTSVRATGVAYAAAIGRVGALVSSFFGAAIIQSGSSAYWYALAICMVCTFFGLAWVRQHFQAVGAITE